MPTTDYLSQAKSFLNRNRNMIALRALPLALMAAAAAHANPNFNGPTTTNIINGCSGGSASGSITGSSTHGGLGLTLSGSGSLSGVIGSGCLFTLQWQGTGSGSFAGTTTTLASGFTITPPGDAFVFGWTLNVLINGTRQAQLTCTSLLAPDVRSPAPRGSPADVCTGAQTIPLQSLTTPATLTSWEVDLLINITFAASGNALTVSVPADTSIDILATPATQTVPALTSLPLAATSVMLLALAAYAMISRRQSGRGLPGPPM